MSKAAAASLPPPPPEVAHLVEQLQRHHLAPDASLLSSSAHSDLLQAREEVAAERALYLEALAVYAEAVAMVEEYHAAAGAGKKLNCSPQVYESLEHRLAVAEAAQRLRLPLLSQDGEVHEQEIEKLSTYSRSSFDSTLTSATPSSSSISTSYNNYSSSASAVTVAAPHWSGSSDAVEPGVGGVPDRFLGITSDYLYQVQQEQPAMSVDMVDYQRTLAREIEARLEAKCDALADLFAMDERGQLLKLIRHPSVKFQVLGFQKVGQASLISIPHFFYFPFDRVKLIIEEIEKEEAHLLEDLASMDRKFAEHYNVLEQILAVLIQFVKDKKLEHQHQFDDLKKTWLIKRCRTMNAKLSYLEHHLLRDTYTKDTVPALHRIRKYLVEATKEASNSYNEAVSRLREYQGVDPRFDVIARQYHEIVKKLEGMQWTIHQVEMDLKPHHDHAAV
ncbi:AUGMIN subunit 4 [Zea mays]|uniref:AUGMIN subunit 4 n=1 Tax=Zea mays TaxID=4577 RepID=A0A1D6GYR6_MAIZE|nr:AUGMIN subunit 4 [Zea mays]